MTTEEKFVNIKYNYDLFLLKDDVFDKIKSDT
jgi:hypothetical protein